MNTANRSYSTSSSAPAKLGPQFQYHRKPAGWAGAPCPVCGCPAKRLRAEHRALTADESWKAQALWVARRKVCFGLDTAVDPIRVNSDGRPL